MNQLFKELDIEDRLQWKSHSMIFAQPGQKDKSGDQVGVILRIFCQIFYFYVLPICMNISLPSYYSVCQAEFLSQ
jgi:hypothetical protein